VLEGQLLETIRFRIREAHPGVLENPEQSRFVQFPMDEKAISPLPHRPSGQLVPSDSSDLSDRSDLSDAFAIRITTAPPEGLAGLFPLLRGALQHRLAAVGAGW
jgi:hypothetical protein